MSNLSSQLKKIFNQAQQKKQQGQKQKDREGKEEDSPLKYWAENIVTTLAEELRKKGGDGEHIIEVDLSQLLQEQIRQIRNSAEDGWRTPTQEETERKIVELYNETFQKFCKSGGGMVLKEFCELASLQFEILHTNGKVSFRIYWNE